MLLAALVMLTAPALAEEGLTSGLSQDYLQITSTFAGSELTVFGDVENPAGQETRDIVVVVRGPDALMTVRRKDRIAGLWINNARAKMWLPAYYFVTATRPLGDIAEGETLRRYELGLNDLRADVTASDGDARPYIASLVRAQKRAGLYIQADSAVEMQSATLFRVHVPIPAAVPRGSYTVEVYLFRDGDVVAAQSTPFYVDQAGFERRVFEFAHTKPFTYGVFTVLMAVALGWASMFLFRNRV
ncbi:TIGR02186 family protein [Rhizomicrobium electricum]|jgi:uncharacterized protein (TIGR02186 family)|uniref:TIGR02186 family protein n=2 Tax=Rhizomicrobium electricum TaxID=480070 RepID=A0ABP3PGV1_9PROT